MQDRLHIEKDDRKHYEELDKEDFFKGKTRKEQFLFAMAVGFKHDMQIRLGSKDGLFNTRDLRLEDEALLNAVAIWKTKSIQCLENKDEMYRIAEEYAKGGIKILVDKIRGVEFGSFWKKLELELYQNYNVIIKGQT
ncbi:MAG: hypothetical protein ACFFG0_19635 [Candidatus Thorarchaeota archaeon]